MKRKLLMVLVAVALAALCCVSALAATDIPAVDMTTGGATNAMVVGSAVYLNATDNDPTEGSTFTYAWTYTFDGGTAQNLSETTGKYKFEPTVTGTYVYSCAVTETTAGGSILTPVTKSVTVTVDSDEKTVAVTPAEKTITMTKIGETATVTATLMDGTTPTQLGSDFTSKNSPIATVTTGNTSATVTAAGKGTTKIVAAIEYNSSAPDAYKKTYNAEVAVNVNIGTKELSVKSCETATVTVSNLLAAVNTANGFTAAEDQFGTATGKTGYTVTLGTIPASLKGTLYKETATDANKLTDAATITDVTSLIFKADNVAADQDAVTIPVYVTYEGRDYECDIVVTVKKTDALTAELDSVVNGNTDTVTTSEMKTALVAAIYNSTKKTVKTTDITELTILTQTAPITTSSYWTLYQGTKIDKDKVITETTADFAATDLYLNTVAGYLGTAQIPFEATVNGIYYNGTFNISIAPKTAKIADEVDATFAKEEFYVSVPSGYYSFTVVATGTAPSAYTGYYTDGTGGNCKTQYQVSNSDTFWGTSTSKQTLYIVALDRYGVASTGTITVDRATYDFSTSVKDEGTPFDADDFQTFMKAVYTEQDEYYNVAFSSVSFPSNGSTSTWLLYDGSKKVTSTTKYDAEELETLTLTVKKAGTYYIPFYVNYNYYTSKTASVSKTTSYYAGVIRVVAVTDGDITYECEYSSTVNFDTDDFEDFFTDTYSGGTLTYVMFGEATDGTLYTYYTTASKKSVIDTTAYYYADPTKTQKDLDDVTFGADATPKTEYSVYIPFTAVGTNAKKATKTLDGTVEIKVNTALPFTDVAKTNTFYENIRYVYRNDIIGGYSDNTFRPGNNVSRAQLVVMLYRMAGSPKTSSTALTFKDTGSLSTEFTNAIKWAVANKIVSGYADNTFCPNAPVTRQAMVTILYRYAQYKGYNVSVSAKASIDSYKDGSKVSSGMKNAVIWAVYNSFVSGTNDGSLNPTGYTTRGAAAKILHNFHALYVA